jgi:hypothetical protein
MTRAEKLLYHQLHPLKLLTDFATSFLSASLLWQRAWWLAAAVAFAPSIIVTSLLLWRAELEPLRDSPLGRYVAVFMTRTEVAIRSAGQVVMWLGAATHEVWLLPLGFLIVAFGWLRGFWLPR